MCGDSTAMSFRQWLAPSGLFCSQFEDGALPRHILQELASQFERIFSSGNRKFVEERFDDKAADGISDGSPETQRNAGIIPNVFNSNVRNCVGQFFRTID